MIASRNVFTVLIIDTTGVCIMIPYPSYIKYPHETLRDDKILAKSWLSGYSVYREYL